MGSIQTRFRRTFKHDDDDDNQEDSNLAIALDDVQQESLIAALHQSAQSTDALYTHILTTFSLLGIVPIVLFFFLFSPPSPRFLFLETAVALAVLSLLLTAWTAFSVPPSATATIPGLSPWWMPFRWPEKNMPFHSSPSSDRDDIPGPGHGSDYEYLAQVLTWVNLAVVSGLFIIGSYWTLYASAPGPVTGRGKYDDSLSSPPLFSLLSLLLPGIIFTAVSMVRQSMADVQNGVIDLQGLKYDLKGA